MGSLKNIAAAGALVAALTPLSAHANVVISSAPTQNMTCANGVCAPVHGNAVLNVTDLTNLLAAGDVTVTAFFGKRKHNKEAGPIEINTPLSWVNSSKLTLYSTYGVDVEAPVTVMGTGALAIGYYYFSTGLNGSVTFWDLNSSFSIVGTTFTLVADLPTLVADIAAAPGGAYALANNYDAAGDVFLKAPIPQFTGQLTGLGHNIANLKLKKGYGDCEGLVSANRGTLRDLRLQVATIISTKQKYVGALAGCNYGYISNVSVDGSVAGDNNANVGGIAGINLENGSGVQGARATVTVTGGQVGGIVGENDSYVYEAYASGSMTGNSNTGGLVGANKYSVRESYATASVNGTGGAAGGLAGFNSATIADSYSIGTISGTGIVGGFVGYDPNESVSNGYWDLDTSGISDPNQGAGFPRNDPTIIGLTTAELQSRLPAGFSKSIWALDSNINNGFPYLLGEPPQ